LDRDPGSEEAQAFVGRWFALWKRAIQGDPDVQVDSPTAWMDRANWPAAMKQRVAEFRLEEIMEFIKKAAGAVTTPHFTDQDWSKLQELGESEKENASARWQARVDLFRDIEGSLSEDPAGEKAQSLAARYLTQLDQTTGGIASIKAAMRQGWSRRRDWPEWY